MAIGLIASLLVPSVASAIDEFPVGVRPGGITTGPDRALWFTEEGGADGISYIGRFVPSTGAYTHFPIPGTGNVPDKITVGPDGNLWFSEFGADSIGRVDLAGNVTEFPNAGGGPSGITAGPGGLWFTAGGSSTVRRMTTNGSIDAIYPTQIGSSDPSDITLGLDGRIWFTESNPLVSRIGAVDPNNPPGATNPAEYPATTGSEPSGIASTTGGILWFTEPGTNGIGRITTGGAISEFGPAGVSASGIAAGRDGALWYTLGFSGTVPCTGAGDQAIGRITSGGTFTNKFATPTPASDPSDIAEGPDGALWFTEYCANKIARIATATPPPPPPPPPPVVVLGVSKLSLGPSSFRAAPKGASITKAKFGTKVTYGLTAAATTRFTVESVQKGRKSGKKCGKPTAKNKKGKKCTRYVVVKGSFKHAGKAGSNSFRFSGRVGNKRLSPGKYRLVAVASGGGKQSNAKRANFKIVR
ncbi:MAG: hypothetical protein C5B48_10500 [Candidatus Rokuibacteriota bacterium]|nr:MAG: hypothetical protein C5B48_10500 [Candidatus Rokubacteria bacterium]